MHPDLKDLPAPEPAARYADIVWVLDDAPDQVLEGLLQHLSLRWRTQWPQPQAHRPQPQAHRPQPQAHRPQPQVSRPQPQVSPPQPQAPRPQQPQARPG